MEYKGYEPVIGLEVHVELKTEKKAFCACSAEYGGEPDSKTCPVCLGMPGAMPAVNPQILRLGVAAGLSLGCRINRLSRFDRKHYFYPDLPKGYQITQYYDPLCEDGEVSFELDGVTKNVRIERIHLEEDAGKLTYDGDSLTVDHNRCGVPLIEIVTCPDMRSPEEAMAFAAELRRRLLFAGVSDCKMNEGSLRCDVNISVKPVDAEQLGNRCEIKNINSVYFIGKAIEYETERQADAILGGETVTTETRRFDEERGITLRMRNKETPEDYRYIREPDIPPILTPPEYVERVRASLPPSAEEYGRLLSSHGVKEQDVRLACAEPAYAEYLAESLRGMEGCGAVPSLFISEVLPQMKSGSPCLTPEALRAVSELYSGGEVNIVSARRILGVCGETGENPSDVAGRLGLYMIRNPEEIKQLVSDAALASPKAVEDIRRGKESAKKVIVGQVMRASGGRADPAAVNAEVDRYFS